MGRVEENKMMAHALAEDIKKGNKNYAEDVGQAIVSFLNDISKSLAVIADSCEQERHEAVDNLTNPELRWFYFTFDSADLVQELDTMPFSQDEYVVVRAKDIVEAAKKFMDKYPNYEDPDIANCENYYGAADFAPIYAEKYAGKMPAATIY